MKKPGYYMTGSGTLFIVYSKTFVEMYAGVYGPGWVRVPAGNTSAWLSKSDYDDYLGPL